MNPVHAYWFLDVLDILLVAVLFYRLLILVKGTSNYSLGAQLIEQYAQTVAAKAVLDAVTQAGDRILAVVDAQA